MRSHLGKTSLLLSFLFLWIHVQSQIANTSGNPVPAVILPDSLKSYDAVVLMENNEIVYRISSYYNSTEALLKSQIIHKQIKILTKKGLEDYTFLSVPKSKYTEVDSLNIFLIKPNGNIIKEKNEIREIRDPNYNSTLRYGYYRISFSGAEIGDVVDFSIRLTNPVEGGYPQDIFFHENIPILNSTTTLRLKNTLRFKIQGYNGLNVATVPGRSGDSVYRWIFPYIPAIKGMETCILENELPFCRFMITGVHLTSTFKRITKLTPDSWGATFEPTIKRINRSSPKRKKSEYFNELISNLTKGCEPNNKLSELYKVFSYINDSIKLKETQGYENYSSGYYLWNKSIDRYSLYLLYKDLFRHFGYPGYFVFAKNKFSGILDVNWITSDFYNQLYLAFKDESGNLHYIYPKTDVKTYQIDEIDPNVMGTKAFLVSVDDAYDYSELTLPSTGYETNTHERYTKATVQKDSLLFEVKNNFKGSFSTIEKLHEGFVDKDSLSTFFRKLIEKELENFKIDTFFFGKTEPIFPFSYSRSYTGSQSSQIVSINDSVFTISLGDWIDHATISTDLETRSLAYYLLFPYTDKLKIEYTFPYPVTLLNEKSLTTFYDNEFGTYSLQISKSAENKITVESLYCIKSPYIPVNKYNLLKEINLRQKQFKDSKMILQKHLDFIKS
ncbi:MAG: DUF3857 domain-containing protein [Bacteroidales bacterium]|nr:DUF3857 domain-containing protein [Bacteroidales bacterium]